MTCPRISANSPVRLISTLALAVLTACGDPGTDTAGPPALDASLPGASAADGGQELSCGSYDRVNTAEREVTVDLVRSRDFEAEAAREWSCVEPESAVDAGVASALVPDYLREVGCLSDFELLAANTAAGMSVKVLMDRAAPLTAEGEFPLYFINSNRFGIHHEFAFEVVNGIGPDGETLPPVPALEGFNTTEYTSPSRRFLLGALTFYPGTQSWVYELAPNDSADAGMITSAFDLVAKHSWVGGQLRLHTTADGIAQAAQELPEDIVAIPTSEVLGGGQYQALNLAESIGRLRFISSEELEEQTKYVDFQDIVVLDRVPNDISVTLGIITAEFQTPLAHINVLSQNRGTPNMALNGAFDDATLRALEDKWVRLEVRQDGYEISEVTAADAAAWWELNRPATVQVPNVDKVTGELRDIEQLVNLEADSIYDAVKKATVTYGGKAAHFATLAHIDGLPVPKAFAVPVRYYFEFMAQNGFDAQVEALLADAAFQDDPAVRDEMLKVLRDEMKAAPVDETFMETLRSKLATDYPGVRMRFRSSTNAEDLDGFTGAGLYTSKSGDDSDPERQVVDAIRKVWASVWFFRAFEERRYRSIAHQDVGMALLVHRSFPDEEANGVALTNNPFDKSGAYPAFYINVQQGEESVVLPPPGQSTDAYLHHWDSGQKVQYYSYSNLVPEDQTVLTTSQIHALGDALDRVRTFFAPAYAPSGGAWWAMDVEFKFDGEPGECPQLFVKQARPFGNR